MISNSSEKISRIRHCLSEITNLSFAKHSRYLVCNNELPACCKMAVFVCYWTLRHADAKKFCDAMDAANVPFWIDTDKIRKLTFLNLTF